MTATPATESAILARALGEMGGLRSSWTAKLLPNVSYEHRFHASRNVDRIRAYLAEVFAGCGRPVPDLPSEPLRGRFIAIMGGGTAGLNPTLVYVEASAHQEHSSLVVIRAVAKEGLVKQQTARGIVQRLTALLQEVS